ICVFNLDTVDQVPMQEAITTDGGWRVDAKDAPQRLLASRRRHGRVQAGEGVGEPPDEDDLVPACTLRARLTRRDRRSVLSIPADIREPVECGFLDSRFRHTDGHANAALTAFSACEIRI